MTDSESAQISLSCGKYLVRVATNDGPGSYPIVVDTGICEIPKVSIWNLKEYVTKATTSLIIVLTMMGIFCAIFIYLYLFEKCFEKYGIKNGKESRMEEGSLTEAEKRLMTKGNLTKIQKKLINQDVLGLYSNYNHSMVNLVQTMDMNVKASEKTQDANAGTQNANAGTQNANASTQNTNANVI